MCMNSRRFAVRSVLIAAGLALATGSWAAPPQPRHAVAPAADATRALADIDKVVAASMAKFGSPGAAVGVIKDGKVVFEKAYGLRNVEEKLPVTPDTLFPIGSISKGFTVTLAAMMVDEGKMDWDTPVRAYLPWFALKDPVASEQITLRDMFTHMSGLPSHDTIRYAVPHSREDLVRGLRYLEPNITFRQRYQYNNLIFTAAGYIVGHVADSDWESLVRQRIFGPLEMKSSNTSVSDSARTDNFSYGYLQNLKGDGPRFRRLDLYDYQKFGVGPNGAVNSTLNDMLHYLSFQMNNGQFEGRRLVSEKQMTEMHSGLVSTGGDKYGEQYGMAWFVRDYGGYRLVSHAGGIFGFHVLIGFIPELNYGFVVFSNQEASEVTRSIVYSITDRMLNLPRTDWVAKLQFPGPEGGDFSLAKPIAPPAHPLSAYTGVYENPAYGRIKVTLAGDQLHLSFPAMEGVVKPHAYDTFDTVFTIWKVDTMTSRTEFHSAPDGKIDAVGLDLTMDGEPGVSLIRFTRIE